MMDDDQPRKDRGSQDPQAEGDDLDTQAILARRRMFVASALAGMSLTAASCEAQVSGSVSVSGNGSTSGSQSAVAQLTGNGNGAVAQPSGNGNGSGAVVAQPCLMVAATTEQDASTSGPVLTEFDSGTSGHVNVQPCLMVIAPSAMDAGVRSDARSDGASAPSFPDGGAVSMPCLSMPAPRDAGVPQACLRMVMPRDAGTDARADGGAMRDSGVMPRPCLEMAVPQPCLTPARPVVPQPCLTPVRKDIDTDDE
jgi:hypothetical protein